MEPRPRSRFRVVGGPDAIEQRWVAPNIEINLTAPELDPCVEEAAMLFAGDQVAAARAALEPEVTSGNCAEAGWWMLFELHEILGERAAFEALALSYAARFEKSPPTWVESRAGVIDPTATTAGRLSMSLGAALDARSDDVLKQVTRAVAANQPVRIDLSKIKHADNGGCALLARTLRKLRQDGRDCVLQGAEHLARVLAAKIAPGAKSDEDAWLLLLELYQRLNAQDSFDDTALHYAETFEMSPPSWEMPSKKPRHRWRPGRGRKLAVAGPVLVDEVVGGGAGAFASAGGGRPERGGDRGRCQPIAAHDFLSAGMLLMSSWVCSPRASG